jgi:hypothetical protein
MSLKYEIKKNDKHLFYKLLRATGSISSSAVEDIFNFNKHETLTF